MADDPTRDDDMGFTDEDVTRDDDLDYGEETPMDETA